MNIGWAVKIWFWWCSGWTMANGMLLYGIGFYEMVAEGVDTIYIENDNGVLTAYAVGGKPSGAYNITVVLSEV